ncbi:hypothetical protein CK203_075086 [Vitis vinifera]|uniref:Uncharacterized protein n=1 Tax=Vitis vinifera TaxID=29760 RepID=A0A438F9Q7_VITVI|nr:hypothetical protein CK203_075086 [Vitis vinifera]
MRGCLSMSLMKDSVHLMLPPSTPKLHPPIMLDFEENQTELTIDEFNAELLSYEALIDS